MFVRLFASTFPFVWIRSFLSFPLSAGRILFQTFPACQTVFGFYDPYLGIVSSSFISRLKTWCDTTTAFELCRDTEPFPRNDAIIAKCSGDLITRYYFLSPRNVAMRKYRRDGAENSSIKCWRVSTRVMFIQLCPYTQPSSIQLWDRPQCCRSKSYTRYT